MNFTNSTEMILDELQVRHDGTCVHKKSKKPDMNKKSFRKARGSGIIITQELVCHVNDIW